jgi:hypothetical protein
MKEETLKLLEDIRVSINNIDSFLEGVKGFSDLPKLKDEVNSLLVN